MNNNKEKENFKLLGFLGIFKESFKLIFTYPIIFLQITLISILPESCFLLVDDRFSTLHHFSNLSTTTFEDNQVSHSPRYIHILGSTISKEVLAHLAVQAAYFIFSTICSLIAVSTTVYTISCIYNNQEITFKKVIKVVPKVWKPYMITYLTRFFVTTLANIPFIIWIMIIFVTVSNQWRMIFILIGFLCFMVTLSSLSIIWQLSDAISVMEKICGFEALKKSRALIKGKAGTALAIFCAAIISSMPIILLVIRNDKQVIVGDGDGVGAGVANYYKFLYVIWFSFVSLFFIVAQGVFYFECKSYHQEDIDEYLEEYVSLKSEIV